MLDPNLKSMKPVSSKPSAAEVKEARETLRYPIRQFPYVAEPKAAPGSNASYAHALSLMLVPFIKQVIGGHIPIHVFSAPTERTGKGKLINSLCMPGRGSDMPIMPEVGKDADELRKRLTSLVISGATLAFFDNVSEVVEGGALAAILTAKVWQDRVLGKSKLVDLPVRTTWIIAGNNIMIARELLLRTLFVILDANMQNPERRNFEELKNPETYTLEHRAEMVRACLTLVQNWLAQGRPRFDPPVRLGGFDEYIEVMGGILGAAGIMGFLAT